MNELELRAQNPRLLWENNPVLIQLLGLSPLLAVSSTLTYGLALGSVTLCVCVISCVTVSAIRRYIPNRWRLIWFMVILASYATAAEILAQLYFYPLSLRLGIYIPLVCCNVAILLRMELVAAVSPWPVAAADGLKTGLGFLAALLLFSAMRELLISGSLFANWQLLQVTEGVPPTVADADIGRFFSFADTQAGVFILLGLLLALLNLLSSYARGRGFENRTVVVPAKRARVTGRLVRDDTKVDRSDE